MSAQDMDINSPNLQKEKLELEKKQCRGGLIPYSGWCPETWDSILCWPPTAPGEMTVLPCPRYIAGFDSGANATRQCMQNGEWYWNTEINQTWSNYTQCYNTQLVTVLMDFPEIQSNTSTLIQEYLPLLKTIATIGYAVSLSTLIVAFCILATIKKLRCPRNMLHMHLFASFMMRAFMALLKHVLFVSGIGLASDVLIKNGESYFHSDVESNWHCKVFTSFWQYFILANYSWILMEGLYLHNLVFFALFAESNSSITAYVALGWGLPAIFVFPWIFLRAVFENTFCWTTNTNNFFFLVIRVPTILSILINFVLFINIVRVLLLKLKSTVSEETERYKRWARSTLVLVPLFGVHYAIFLGMSYSIGVNEKVELIWLFGDQLFASFQGFFVAVLYCFLNGEVRTEVARVMRNESWHRRGRGPTSSMRSTSTCSCKNPSLRKKSKREWWNVPLVPSFFQENRMHHRSSHSMASTQQDVATRGCSLASSRNYLDTIGPVSYPRDSQSFTTTHNSLMSNKHTDQSMLSFCSHMSEVNGCPNITGDIERSLEQHELNEPECCCLELELENYP